MAVAGLRITPKRLAALAAVVLLALAASAGISAGTQDPQPLLKLDPTKEDYIKVAPGGRYFVHSDGRFFTPLGYNHNPDWGPFGQGAPGRRGYNPQATESYFRHLRDRGVNLIRMMLECPLGGKCLEDPIGTFSPEHTVWIDNLMTYARRYGVRLMITPWDTFWMNHRWDDNPYNSKLGGPVEKKLDFITKRQVIAAQKKRWRYILDRWGNTGAVFCWELLNEADYWWGASPEQLSAWAKEMAAFVRGYEQRKWGRTHLISISTGRPIPEGKWGDLAYRLPEMDFATTHLYLGAANAPEEPIQPALAIQRGVSFALAKIRDRRPYLDGENGPINKWIADGNLDNEVFHHMSWAHLASGGAGSGLRWPYRNPHQLSEGMLHALSLMSRFAKAVPWGKLCQPAAALSIKAPEGWIACSTATKQASIIWLAAEKVSQPSDLRLAVSWPGAPGRVTYRVYDTRAGKWLPGGSAKSAKGELMISLTAVPSSVALVMQGS